MMIRRREFLTGLGAAALLPALGIRSAAAELRMGGMTVTSVSDGNLVLPGDFAFAHLPQDELAVVLAEHDVSRDEVRPPCNLTLLQDGTRSVLFDAGSGPAFMPSAGELVGTLDALGVAPGDITHVVFTHAHPDHLWGVLDDFDDPLFFNAEYMIGQREWDYWMDPATLDTIAEDRVSFVVGAQRRLEVIGDRTRFISGGQEVLPGVMAHDSFGHTPGHMSFELRGGGDALLVAGDAIGNAHVAFARPDWPSGSDHQKEVGIETRMRLLDMLANDKMQVLGFHLPNGGLGRVERTGENYTFVQEG